jgi:hypothetical protein
MPPETAPQTNVGSVTAVLSMALQVLSTRIVILLAMCMTFGLFVASMCLRDWISVAIASAFALLVFWPVFWRTQNARKND